MNIPCRGDRHAGPSAEAQLFPLPYNFDGKKQIYAQQYAHNDRRRPMHGYAKQDPSNEADYKCRDCYVIDLFKTDF